MKQHGGRDEIDAARASRRRGAAAPRRARRGRRAPSGATPTTIAANQTVPSTAVKKYTVPNAKSSARTRFSRSVRGERPVRRSFSRTRKRNAGASPASQMTNCPSRKFSGVPASFTKEHQHRREGRKADVRLALELGEVVVQRVGGGPLREVLPAVQPRVGEERVVVVRRCAREPRRARDAAYTAMADEIDDAASSRRRRASRAASSARGRPARAALGVVEGTSGAAEVRGADEAASVRQARIGGRHRRGARYHRMRVRDASGRRTRRTRHSSEPADAQAAARVACGMRISMRMAQRAMANLQPLR